MTYIEVLPNPTTTSSTPGWAYVPDTGYDPSRAAIIPTGARKRTNRAGQLASAGTSAAGGANEILSAREQNKINTYLEHLQKDSLKDVQIVLHNKARDLGSRGLRGKMTPGVRKIVQSQKTFANHLADEEAALANQQQQQQTPTITTTTARTTPAAVAATTTSQAMQIDKPPRAEDGDVADEDDDTLLFHDPGLPRAPTEEEIEALLAAPALSYTAARAAPSASSAPPCRFCSMCGYFASIRCTRCSASVCGLECKLAHDEGKCLKF